MIYGKLSFDNWRTATIGGEAPQSSFETHNLRLYFYGTLYNRDAFQALPTDTFAQIAAEAYLSDLTNGFSRLHGSFTIVYFSEYECGVVRDTHGTHYPVYILKNGEFATSLSHFTKDPDNQQLNTEALSHALQRGLLPPDRTPFSNIGQVRANYHFRICDEAFLVNQFCLNDEERKYLNDLKEIPAFNNVFKRVASEPGCVPNNIEKKPQPVIEKTPDVEAYSHRYGELHRQAIRRCIGDSRRVGILLSGGYDSGSNLAALRQVYDGAIDSYSIGFKGDTWTELPLARIMSDTFGTRHHEYEIDGTEINALPDIVRFLGEPFVEGGLMVNYCAMRMIGPDKPEVILGGDGSDQYFGTSGREVALHYLAGRTGMRPLLHGIQKLLSRDAFDTGGKLSRINFHLDKVLHILEGERFGFSDSALRQFLQHPDEDFNPAPTPKSNLRSFQHLYTQHALESDLKIVINRIILFKASRMAQMFNNHLAFPFMDADLYRFLQQLPVGLKCHGDSVFKIARGQFTSKYLLKHHYKPLLPPAITAKKKQGGFAPMPLFFRDPLQRARLKAFILSSGICNNYLRRDTVERFLNAYDRDASQEDTWFWHRQNRALQYFNLLTLVIWWEEFVEGKEVKY